MSLHRRPVGRGRILAAVGSLILIVACVPPWFTAGSASEGLPQISGYAFDGSGIAVFFVGLAAVALITLPYASDRPVGIDRWWAYAALAIAGWVGVAVHAVDIVLKPGGLETLTPDRAPGLWLSVLGLIVLSRAAYQIAGEPLYR